MSRPVHKECVLSSREEFFHSTMHAVKVDLIAVGVIHRSIRVCTPKTVRMKTEINSLLFTHSEARRSFASLGVRMSFPIPLHSLFFKQPRVLNQFVQLSSQQQEECTKFPSNIKLAMGITGTEAKQVEDSPTTKLSRTTCSVRRRTSGTTGTR